MTGHLVFSTLHTNDAVGGITRLLDMDVEPFLLASVSKPSSLNAWYARFVQNAHNWLIISRIPHRDWFPRERTWHSVSARRGL